MGTHRDRINIRHRICAIDLSWVDSSVLRYVNIHITTLDAIRKKKVEAIITNNLIALANAFLAGFEIPFNKLPLRIGSHHPIISGVVKYRLAVGR